MKEDFSKTVKKAIKGDRRAFSRICEEKGRSILYLCVKIMGNFHDGEDAAQEILLMMQKDLVKLKNPDAFNTWLYRLIVRNCVKMKESLQQGLGLPIEECENFIGETSNEFIPHSFIESEDNKQLLMQAIDGLPDDCRICMLLFYFEGLKYTEIANALSVTTNDVGNLLVKAKKQLKRELEKNVPPGTFTVSGVAAAGAMPVVAQLFAEESASIASSVAVKKMIEGAGISGSWIGAGAKSSCVKAVAGATAATVAIISASALLVFANIDKTTPLPLDSGSYTVQVSQAAPANTAEEPAAIVTLDDMLGKEQADILRQYGISGFDDKQQIKDFFAANQIEFDYEAVDAEKQDTYEVYYRYRGDKLLMVILKLGTTNSGGVAFRFAQKDEPRLQHVEAYFNFEQWQQQQSAY